MNNIEGLILTLTVIAVMIAAVAVVIPALRKHGVDIDARLKDTQDALAAANAALELAKPFMAESTGIAKIEAILELARTGAGSAEQLLYIEKLPPGERREHAKKFAVDALKIAGVEVTPEIDAVIDSVIEDKVWSIGHATGIKIETTT